MNANFMLACAFPPRNGLKGAMTRICDLQTAKPDPLFCPTKRSAVRLIIAASMACACGYGKGNKASRREAEARTHAGWLASQINAEIAAKRTQRQSDVLAELHPFTK